jgi:hypothetical protein
MDCKALISAAILAAATFSTSAEDASPEHAGVLIDDRTLTLVALCLDDLRGLRYRLSNTSTSWPSTRGVVGLIDRDAVVVML